MKFSVLSAVELSAICVGLNLIQRLEVLDVPHPTPAAKIPNIDWDQLLPYRQIKNHSLCTDTEVFDGKSCSMMITFKMGPFQSSCECPRIFCFDFTSSWHRAGPLTTLSLASPCASWCPSCRKPPWASPSSTCAPSAWTGQWLTYDLKIAWKRPVTTENMTWIHCRGIWPLVYAVIN